MDNKKFAAVIDGLNDNIKSLITEIYVKDYTIEQLEKQLKEAEAAKASADGKNKN